MYHVVPAAARAASLTNGQVLPTLLANQTLTVDISGTPPVVQIIPAGGDPATVIQVGGWVGGWVHMGGWVGAHWRVGSQGSRMAGGAPLRSAATCAGHMPRLRTKPGVPSVNPPLCRCHCRPPSLLPCLVAA